MAWRRCSGFGFGLLDLPVTIRVDTREFLGCRCHELLERNGSVFVGIVSHNIPAPMPTGCSLRMRWSQLLPRNVAIAVRVESQQRGGSVSDLLSRDHPIPVDVQGGYYRMTWLRVRPSISVRWDHAHACYEG